MELTIDVGGYISSKFSRNSEVNTSELIENFEEIFPWVLSQISPDLHYIKLNSTISTKLFKGHCLFKL